MEERNLKLMVSKGGSGSSSFRVSLPAKWIRDMGLSEDIEDRFLKAIYDVDEKRIIIENSALETNDKANAVVEYCLENNLFNLFKNIKYNIKREYNSYNYYFENKKIIRLVSKTQDNGNFNYHFSSTKIKNFKEKFNADYICYVWLDNPNSKYRIVVFNIDNALGNLDRRDSPFHSVKSETGGLRFESMSNLGDINLLDYIEIGYNDF